MKLLLILLLSMKAPTALADNADIYNKTQIVAESKKGDLLSLSRGESGVDSVHTALQNKEGVANNMATELGQLPQAGEKEKEAKEESSKCTKESCNVSSLFSAKAVNKRDGQLEALGFKKDDHNFPEDSKSYLDKANRKIKEFGDSYNALTGEYKDCKAIEREFSFKETKECDEYYDVKYNNCPISQIVEIDPKYTYQCNKKRQESIKTCSQEITSIKCKKSQDCDNGGVIAASVKSDMKFVYNYPELIIGTIADNYWGGHCAVYDRVTEFEIRNKDKITEFLLTETGFDDYLWIKLNDQTIYVGPDGGDKIEVVNGAVENGNGRRGCERGTNWHRGNINKDLIPYLKEGKNTLFMRVVVAGNGEGWMKIRAKQHCCKDWDITWEDSCDHEVKS